MKFIELFKKGDRSFKRNCIFIIAIIIFVVIALGLRIYHKTFDRNFIMLCIELVLFIGILIYTSDKQAKAIAEVEGIYTMWDKIVPEVNGLTKDARGSKRLNQLMNLKSTEYIHLYDAVNGFSIERVDRSAKRKIVCGPSFDEKQIAREIVEYAYKK